jgi:phosphohistidine phosphatase
MRHGKSDSSSPGEADFDRPLANKGVEAIPKVAAWLRDSGYLPDRILSSPALRARQTTERLAGEIGFNTGDIFWDRRIYNASLDDLLRVVGDACGGAGCVLLVGHNPGLDALLDHVASSPPPRNEEGKLLTTAALAVLDYGETEIHPRACGGKLLHLIRPAEL